MASPERPDIRELQQRLNRMDLPPEVTLMFTDIVDSKLLTDTVKEDVYREAKKIHDDLVLECMAKYRGNAVKTIGDSFFAWFEDPVHGLACTAEIQRRLKDAPIRIADRNMEVRIGAHTGRPKREPDPASGREDFFGGDANKAARVKSLARGGQILISEETKLRVHGLFDLYDWGRWLMKGLGPQRVFEVLWSDKPPQKPAGRRELEEDRFGTLFVGREKEVETLLALAEKQRF